MYNQFIEKFDLRQILGYFNFTANKKQLKAF